MAKGALTGRLRLRQQLPVHSPIPLRAFAASLLPFSSKADAPALLEALRIDFCAGDAVLCGSGTQALQLAIRTMLNRTRSAAVALPGFCCYDVASAAVGADAAIALYDLDPDTLSPDLESLERLLQSGVRAIVVAHLYGMPVDWDALVSLAARYGAELIEDAAQGHAGYLRNRRLGSLGGVSVLSFGRGKGWTGGGGGALLLRDGLEEATVSLEKRSDTGWRGPLSTLAQLLLGRPAVYGLPASIPALALGETRYHAPAAPVQMTDFSAGLALRTHRASELEAAARSIAAVSLLRSLGNSRSIVAIRAIPGARPGYLRLPVRIEGGFRSFDNPDLALRLGLGRSYPTTLLGLAQVRERLTTSLPTLPGASLLERDLITLPTHSLVRPDERNSLLRLLETVEGSSASSPRQAQSRSADDGTFASAATTP